MIQNLKVNSDFNQQLEGIVELTADCREAASINRWLNSKNNSQPLPSYFPTARDIEESFQKNVFSVIEGEKTDKSLIKQK